MTRRRGFTLIELSVVIVILAMVAATIIPNLASSLEAGKRRGYYLDLVRTIKQAKELSAQSRRTVTLSRPEDGEWVLRYKENSTETNTQTDSSQSNLARLPDVDGVSPQVDSSFTMSFYPDGTTSGGSIEVSENGHSRFLSVRADTGKTEWMDEQPPQEDNTRWQAGEVEQRGG